tara:strand:- start:729 stop:1430 length:702 start_codon:yes stop_codon:yes gene_type:complete
MVAVFAKMENLNPTGSVKDRMAINMVKRAEESGQLKPGGTIVESTSGNTGLGLAMAAAAKGYCCIFTIPDKMRFIQKTIGNVSSPFDCWLNLSGLKTLHLRMQRHSESALKVAKFLENHDKIKSVLYPDLASHPQHEIAKQQMSGFSGMISFELTGGTESGKQLMNNVKLCGLAESLGSVETMIAHPATMTHADVPSEDRARRRLTDGLVRLSVGIEDMNDIIYDLEEALEKT